MLMASRTGQKGITMATLTPSRKLVTKALATTAICAAVAVGAAAPAFAATPSGSTPTHLGRCGRAPKALARLAKVESRVSQRITKLEAVESKLTGAGHQKAAARVEKRLNRLQRIESRAGARVSNIEARCPAGTTGSGSTSD
jgi:hypothetical protein